MLCNIFVLYPKELSNKSPCLKMIAIVYCSIAVTPQKTGDVRLRDGSTAEWKSTTRKKLVCLHDVVAHAVISRP